MLEKLGRVLGDGLLAMSVMCGPGICLLAFGAAYTSWLIGTGDATVVGFLCASFVFAGWAVWGIVSGPWRLRLWWFALASILNLIAGFAITVSDRPHAVKIGILFLGYSLWQAIVFSRRAPKRLID